MSEACSRRAALGALAGLPALAILPAAAVAAPGPDSDLLALIERHRKAREEYKAAAIALDALEMRLGDDEVRPARAMKYQCATWRGQEGKKVYVYMLDDIDAWCDNPKGIPFVLLDKETPDQIRARLHAELVADEARQLAKRVANGDAAAERRLDEAEERDEELQGRIMAARPGTIAGALALLSYAAEIDDPGMNQTPLCIVARNIIASGALARDPI